MQFGTHLPQYGRVSGPDAIQRAARHAEELGFADVWVSDHVLQPAAQEYPSPYLYDPFLTLTWAAASTDRIGLGTSVLVAPQYHPLWLANTTSSLDALSGGRLRLGVGVGWSEAEFEALGQGFHNRGRRTDEILDILEAAGRPTRRPTTATTTRSTTCACCPSPPTRSRCGSVAGVKRLPTCRRHGCGFHLIGLKPDTIVEPGRLCARSVPIDLHDLAPHRLGSARHGPR